MKGGRQKFYVFAPCDPSASFFIFFIQGVHLEIETITAEMPQTTAKLAFALLDKMSLKEI